MYGMEGLVSNARTRPPQLESWDYGRKNMHPLWVECVQQGVWDEEFFFHHQNPSSMAIEIVLDGGLYIHFPDAEIHLEKNMAAILPPGKENRLRTGKGESCRKISLCYCGQLYPSLMAMLRLPSGTGLRIKEPERIFSLYQELYILLREKDEKSIAKISGLGYEFLCELALQSSSGVEQPLADAIRIMEFNYMSNISVREIAERLNLSEDTLNRMFQRCFGQSPKQYMIALRLKNAKLLLEKTKLSIKEIAITSGYTTQIRFAAEFHKKEGISPMEYRKKHQKR